jgi:hypothetical protein
MAPIEQPFTAFHWLAIPIRVAESMAVAKMKNGIFP